MSISCQSVLSEAGVARLNVPALLCLRRSVASSSASLLESMWRLKCLSSENLWGCPPRTLKLKCQGCAHFDHLPRAHSQTLRRPALRCLLFRCCCSFISPPCAASVAAHEKA